MEGSIFSPALEALEHVRSEDGKILTKPFLDVCKFVLPVLGIVNVLWIIFSMKFSIITGKCIRKLSFLSGLSR